LIENNGSICPYLLLTHGIDLDAGDLHVSLLLRAMDYEDTS
jgi:hypothetical protein